MGVNRPPLAKILDPRTPVCGFQRTGVRGSRIFGRRWRLAPSGRDKTELAIPAGLWGWPAPFCPLARSGFRSSHLRTSRDSGCAGSVSARPGLERDRRIRNHAHSADPDKEFRKISCSDPTLQGVPPSDRNTTFGKILSGSARNQARPSQNPRPGRRFGQRPPCPCYCKYHTRRWGVAAAAGPPNGVRGIRSAPPAWKSAISLRVAIPHYTKRDGGFPEAR